MFKSKEHREAVSKLFKEYCIPHIAGSVIRPIIPDPTRTDFDIETFGSLNNSLSIWLMSSDDVEKILPVLKSTSGLGVHAFRGRSESYQGNVLQSRIACSYALIYAIKGDTYRKRLIPNTVLVNGYRMFKLEFLLKLYERKTVFGAAEAYKKAVKSRLKELQLTK